VPDGAGKAAVADKGAAAGTAHDKDAPKDTWGATPTEATPPRAGATGDDKGDADDKDDKVDKPAPAKHGAKLSAGDDAVAEALEQLDETILALPPEQQKRLAAYKGLAKLSPRERAKKLRQLAALGVTMPGLDGAEAPDPGGDGDTPARPGAPAVSAPAGAWITNHSIDPPTGYDPQHLDVTAFLSWAVAQARKEIPDAQLIRIDTNGVSADGRANLKLPSLASDHGSIDVRFISPSRGKRDPSQPLGVARHDFKCEFRVEATPDGVEVMPIDFADCSKEHVVAVPKCSFSGVWKKAIARKAPSRNAVGNVDYRSNGSKPVWYFDIGSGFDVVFSEMFGDDC
jgi:hypothetical protein